MPNLSMIWRSLGIWMGCESAVFHQHIIPTRENQRNYKDTQEEKETAKKGIDDIVHSKYCISSAWEWEMLNNFFNV